MTHHRNRLPHDWRNQPDHILYNWLDFSCNDYEHQEVMQELTTRRHLHFPDGIGHAETSVRS